MSGNCMCPIIRAICNGAKIACDTLSGKKK